MSFTPNQKKPITHLKKQAQHYFNTQVDEDINSISEELNNMSLPEFTNQEILEFPETTNKFL